MSIPAPPHSVSSEPVWAPEPPPSLPSPPSRRPMWLTVLAWVVVVVFGVLMTLGAALAKQVWTVVRDHEEPASQRTTGSSAPARESKLVELTLPTAGFLHPGDWSVVRQQPNETVVSGDQVVERTSVVSTREVYHVPTGMVQHSVTEPPQVVAEQAVLRANMEGNTPVLQRMRPR